MWEHELWDYGQAWWRKVLQVAGGVLGLVAAVLRESDWWPFLILAGMLYGTLAAGAAYHYRDFREDGDLDSWQLFLAHAAATVAFTYFFFFFRWSCGSAWLIFSPILAALAGVGGAAIGLVWRPRSPV